MYDFKIWDQAHQGKTIGLRVADTKVLKALTKDCVGPDESAWWTSLADYLGAAKAGGKFPPLPFVRSVDVLWLKTGFGLPAYSICHGRPFRVTYTGINPAKWSPQGYLVLDPAWNAVLAPFHKTPVSVRYLAGPRTDLIVVLP